MNNQKATPIEDDVSDNEYGEEEEPTPKKKVKPEKEVKPKKQVKKKVPIEDEEKVNKEEPDLLPQMKKEGIDEIDIHVGV